MRFAAFTLTAVLALSAHLALPQMAMAEDMQNMNMHDKTAASAADKAYVAAMRTMMSAMNVESTGNPDKDFALMMIPHHQAAIDMAKAELQYGTNPEIRQLATDIVAAQEKEIAQMKKWLAKHGK